MRNDGKIQVLRRARELLARPYGWIKGDYRTDVPVRDRTYRAYCLAGACGQAALELELEDGFRPWHVAVEVSLEKLAISKGYSGIPGFNDDKETRKKDVLALIDERIAQLEKA